MDIFLLLTIKVFECLYQKANEFLHQCVNTVWGTKGIGGLLLLVLCTLYRQKVSMALQHAQAISILRCVVAIGEGFS
jgi:hypothetical protein